MQGIYFLISFLSCLIGGICGLGGGIIIKPVLDLAGLASVSAISFMSGCTVLAMSCYSVGRSFSSKTSVIDAKTSTPLAIGAVIGGIIGKQMFQVLSVALGGNNLIGGVQAAGLALITLFAFIFTMRKETIRTHRIVAVPVCIGVGLMLGLISSFLGIGGGPINIVAFFYFFSFDAKVAAQNSLYVILLSQAASIITTLVTRNVPEFDPLAMSLMVAGGISGGIAARFFYQRMSEESVKKLFLWLMMVIILISCVNVARFM